jgi:hypothetical protein
MRQFHTHESKGGQPQGAKVQMIELLQHRTALLNASLWIIVAGMKAHTQDG